MSSGKIDETTEHVLPLVEERAVVSRRVEPGERVRVRVVTDTVDETASADVAREEVSVERRPCERPVDHVPEPRTEGDLTIVPVVEERITVQRQLFVTEELLIRRQRTTEKVDVPVRLRRQRVEVERGDAQRSPLETATGEKDQQE